MPSDFRSASLPFMGARPQTPMDGADLVIFGAPHGTPYPDIDNVPYETAPGCLRQALAADAQWCDHWDFDLGGPLLGDGQYKVADAGDLKTAPLDGAGNRRLIHQATTQIVESGAVPVMIGGDDSTPIPFIEALAPRGPLTVIQIDAHIDWREERRGERLGFSSTMRRASEMAHVERIVQVGIRGLGSARRAEVEAALGWGARIVTARELHHGGLEAVMRHVAPGSNCMITLDCDGLDSSIMPAVLAPTPGGLTYLQTIELIEAVTETANLVAFDLIEFVPDRDSNGTSAFTAARVLAQVIGRLARA